MSTGHRLFGAAWRGAIALCSVAVIVVTWYLWSALGQLNHGGVTAHVIDPSLLTAPPAATGSGRAAPAGTATDILLVGLDSRRDVQGNPLPPDLLSALNAGADDGTLNTDTMMVVHIPAGGGAPTVISFPRDSYVDIAGGFGKHKLNSAYAYARNAMVHQLTAQGATDQRQIEQQADDAGRRNLIATIENLTGHAITITRYAEINLYGFYLISQALGGVPVCVRAAITDPESQAHFPAGTQLLSGTQALNFVRQRYGLPRGDLDRIARQQAFLAAAAKQVLAAGTLTDPARLSALIDAINKSIVLSDGWNITDFAQQLQSLGGADIRLRTVPISGSARNGDGDVLLVDPNAIHQFVTSLVAAPAPAAAPTPTAGRVSTQPADYVAAAPADPSCVN